MIDLKLAAAVAAFTGAALLTVNWYFYSKGYHAAESKLMQEMADLRAANGIIIREQEQKYLAERDRISAEYQTTIEGLKAAHDKEIIDLNRLRDTVRVPECVPVSANKSGVQECPQKPQIDPTLSATPTPNYRERLKAVWISPQSATNSQ